MSSREETNRATPNAADDPLLRALRELPELPASASRQERSHEAARNAFLRASGSRPSPSEVVGTPGLVTVGGTVFRGATAIVLAGVVGVYLLWAFAAAIALNQ